MQRMPSGTRWLRWMTFFATSRRFTASLRPWWISLSRIFTTGRESMSKVRVASFSISVDGFGAGPRQDLQNPLGVRGMELHSWFFPTEAFKRMTAQDGGTTGVDNQMALRSFENVGAWILGRNMFGPVRGPWPNESWKGWW